MNYVLLVLTTSDGFIVGFDSTVTDEECNEFVLEYNGDTIHQMVFSEDNKEVFYTFRTLYNPELICPLNVL